MHTKKGLPHELCFVFLFIVLVSIEDLLDFYSPVALSQQLSTLVILSHWSCSQAPFY